MSTEYAWIHLEGVNPPVRSVADEGVFASVHGLGLEHTSQSRVGLCWRIPVHEGMFFLVTYASGFPDVKIVEAEGEKFTAKEFLDMILTYPMRYGNRL